MINKILISRIVVSTAILAFILTSFTACTTLVVKDEIGIGKPKGYVAFYSPDLIIHVWSIQDGTEIDEGGNNSFWTGLEPEFRIARTPGQYEFVISHKKNYKEGFSVSVFPDAITYVSVEKQVLSSSSFTYSGAYVTTTSTTETYRVHTSIGSTPLPISPTPSDAGVLVSALADQDTGTRLFALKGLAQANVMPDHATRTQIRCISSRLLLGGPWRSKRTAQDRGREGSK